MTRAQIPGSSRNNAVHWAGEAEEHGIGSTQVLRMSAKRREGKKRSLSWALLYTVGENMSQEHPTKKARAGDNPAADCASGGSDPLCYVAICTPMLSAAAAPFTQPRNRKQVSATQ